MKKKKFLSTAAKLFRHFVNYFEGKIFFQPEPKKIKISDNFLLKTRLILHVVGDPEAYQPQGMFLTPSSSPEVIHFLSRC